ncbi:hypothetical protein AAHE18_09G085700 [Arachis hypogaea]
MFCIIINTCVHAMMVMLPLIRTEKRLRVCCLQQIIRNLLHIITIWLRNKITYVCSFPSRIIPLLCPPSNRSFSCNPPGPSPIINPFFSRKVSLQAIFRWWRDPQPSIVLLLHHQETRLRQDRVNHKLPTPQARKGMKPKLHRGGLTTRKLLLMRPKRARLQRNAQRRDPSNLAKLKVTFNVLTNRQTNRRQEVCFNISLGLIPTIPSQNAHTRYNCSVNRSPKQH